MSKALLLLPNNQDSETRFELDYLFQESKDVFLPFRAVGTFYSLLHDFDKNILLHIHPSLKLEYRLVNVEYGSLKTRVVQVLRGMPDELLKKPEMKTLIGILLLKGKYWLLQKLTNAATIDSKEQLDAISNVVNKEIDEIGKKAGIVTTGISSHAVLNSIDELTQETNKLPKKEAYEFKSKLGNAILRAGIKLNKPKILSELGEKIEINNTTEVIKPKKVDLLGESKWECIMDGKTREMKVEHKEWLEKYQHRQVNIQSGDSLRVKLKTTYSYNANTSKIKVTYDITEVLNIIKPDGTTQLTIDDNH
jgi:hypothetical protein